MKMKKVMLCSLAGAVLLGGGLGLSQAVADEEYVSIPNPDVKAEIYNFLEGNEFADEEALSNLSNYHYISKGNLQSLSDSGYLSIQSKNYENPENTSLEGLQGLSLESLSIDTPLIDITPLRDVTGVRNLTLTDQYNNLGYTHGIKNVDVLRQMTDLEEFYYCNIVTNGEWDEITPLLDLSGLDSMESLRRIVIETNGTLEPIYLNEENNDYEATLPIILSRHFENISDWYAVSDDESYSTPHYEEGQQPRMSDRLVWENIEQGTEYLTVGVSIQGRNLYYIADLKIPIIWE